jgi:preprotein translocase subunit SecA
LWVKHLTDLDELREGIGLRAYAQRDPLVSFRTEASNTYAELLDSIREQVAHRVFNVQFNVAAPAQAQQRRQQQQAQRASPVAIGGRSAVDRAIERGALKASGGGAEAKAGNGRPKPATSPKLGRNDVCPFCSSGKKLKHCDCEGARKWRGEL